MLRYGLGLLGAAAAFAFIVLVPDRATVLIALGLVPMIAMLVPERWAPKVDQRGGAEMAGLSGTALQLVSGVSGPLLDLFFVRVTLDRRRVVASKAVSQTITHLKLLYFGGVASAAASLPSPWIYGLAIALAIAGTSASRLVLERLSGTQFSAMDALDRLCGAISLVQGVRLASL